MKSSSSATALITIWFIFFLLTKETRSHVRHLKLYEFQRKLQRKTTFSSSAATSTAIPKSIGRVFYPVGYGADPTGAQDSAAAILAAVNDAAKVKNGMEMVPGVGDLGGVAVDLQGGTYKISSPITFPTRIGNMVVQGGTLRASRTFPGNRHLIELWAPDSQPSSNPNTVSHNFSDQKDHNNDGIRYEDITFRDILFDSSFRGGGLYLLDSLRIRVLDCFFLRFTTQGILVRRGHETFVSNCFVGQHPTDGGDPDEKNYQGVGIDIASTDNAVTDVVVFSAATGIVLRGNANILTGVHCYNKVEYSNGVGILVQSPSAQNRIVSPYLDYNGIVIEDPNQVHVSNGFFLGDGNIVLKSSTQSKISGLTIVDNIFSGSGNPKNIVPSVKLEGAFKSVDQVVIDRNVVNGGMMLKSTVAKMTVAGNGTKWKADFSKILLFPNKINNVQYSLYYKEGHGFPAHAVTKVSNNVIVIESQQETNAVVSVSVDQYNRADEQNL